MEHYSKDKVILRILNLISFLLLAAGSAGTALRAFGGRIYDVFYKAEFIMSPVKYFHFIYFASLAYMAAFIFVQMDSREHGTCKRVIENYGVLSPLAFIFVVFWGLSLEFLNSKMLTAVIILAALLFSAVLYIKSQQLKKYLYSDEEAIFVSPFSMFTALLFILFLMNFSNLFSKTQGSIDLIVISVIIIVLSVAAGALAMIFLKDKIFAVVQIIYLVCALVQRRFDGEFMPVGYTCFLGIIIIMFVWYRVFAKKKKN